MADIPEKVAKILKDNGFGEEAVWDCHGTWVIYHWVLERLAAINKIGFDAPDIIEADSGKGIVSMRVTGHKYQRVKGGQVTLTEWSIGEAAPKNNKNAYPWAMAEKRAKDRVILKLLGLHGEVYSEEEADSFKEDAAKGSVMRAKDSFKEMVQDIEACSDLDSLDILLSDKRTMQLMARYPKVIPEWFYGGEHTPSMAERIDKKRKELESADSIPTT